MTHRDYTRLSEDRLPPVPSVLRRVLDIRDPEGTRDAPLHPRRRPSVRHERSDVPEESDPPSSLQSHKESLTDGISTPSIWGRSKTHLKTWGSHSGVSNFRLILVKDTDIPLSGTLDIKM